MSTAVMEAPTEELAEPEEDEGHLYCCIDNRPVCGKLTEPVDLWSLGYNGEMSCLLCCLIEGEVVPWVCPRCGCTANTCCNLCCFYEQCDQRNQRSSNLHR
jgi:hypothetical protein